MTKTFIETSQFTQWISSHLSDDDLRRLQDVLLERPDAGVVMRGCGGLRKIRIPDPKRGKGRRSGARVVYLHVAEANRIFLIDVYGKDEKEDLSEGDKRDLTRLAVELRKSYQ